MAEKSILIEEHNLSNEIKFYFKSLALIIIRLFKNSLLYRPEKFSFSNQLRNENVISSSETDLWTTDDNEQNWILTAGKVQNLRVAAQQLNGVEVPENKIFSFWRHIGNPSAKHGYVLGREIREGCIVPTIAGGLCQLSNALYDAALKAGFEITERHKHTKVIKGSLAEMDRDATVKWNYIDLRFRSKHSFRIEIEMTEEKLLLKFKGLSKNNSDDKINPKAFIQSVKLNDCYSCGNFECFKHPEKTFREREKAITTFILDEKWSEYEEYIKSIDKNGNHFIVPLLANRFIKINRYLWAITKGKSVTAVTLITLYRSLCLRIFTKPENNVFSLMLNLDKMVAREMVKQIPIESTHIVISQNLLPFIWADGALGGRTFDVLMTRFPIEKLHERLDVAYQKYPSSQTLNDFRAPEDLIDLENAALTKSRHIVTPHKEIADIFNNKAILLSWSYPKSTVQPTLSGGKILFPASSLGRKGAYEVRQLAKELNLGIKIIGNATEDDSFWNGIKVEMAKTNPFEDVQLLVYPTYIEHQPRILLKAISSGLPIITTTACGLNKTDNVTIIPVGDYEALKRAFIMLYR